MKNYGFSGKKLRISESSGEIAVSFGHEIKKVLVVGGRYIVLLEPQAGTIENCNVVCVDRTGKLIWKLCGSPVISNWNNFTEIELDSETSGYLYAWDWDCYKSKIEIESGKVIESVFVK